MKIDLSNKTKSEREKIFRVYLQKRMQHSKQQQQITMKNMRKHFKVSHLKEKQRIEAFLLRMLHNEVQPLRLRMIDEKNNENKKINKGEQNGEYKNFA